MRILTILLCAIAAVVIYCEEKPLMLIKVFKACDGTEGKLPLEFSNITFKQRDKDTFVLNGHFSLRKKATAPVVGTVTAQLCSDPNNPDSCEFLIQDMEMPDTCELISDTTAAWYQFIQNIKIPPSCPIEPIEAEIDNYIVYNIFGDKLPVPHGLYKVNFTGIMGEDEELMGCVYMEVVI